MERGNEAHSIGRPNLSRIARHRPDLPIVSPALAIRFRPPGSQSVVVCTRRLILSLVKGAMFGS
jgi:hypothetical protein